MDIHNHILPGIDDSAKSIDESLILIKSMRALGVKQFIPTPQVMHNFYLNTDESIGNTNYNLIYCP